MNTYIILTNEHEQGPVRSVLLQPYSHFSKYYWFRYERSFIYSTLSQSRKYSNIYDVGLSEMSASFHL
ncbi:hypothetical protein HanIR_Chr07g0303411 [Helianthus annuus]|nr:hypothetical protein HanIR_Chr07g0303411 [Helianthus annuus]